MSSEEHQKATADVLADAVAALANEAMRHIAKLCAENWLNAVRFHARYAPL